MNEQRSEIMKTHLWPKKGRSRKWLILGLKPWNPDANFVPYLEAASAKQAIRVEPVLGSGCGRSPAGQTSPCAHRDLLSAS